MRPVTLGRALGIGVRLVSKRIMESGGPQAAPIRGAAPTAAATSATTPGRVTVLPPKPVREQSAANAARVAKGLGEGGRRFGRSVWGPFATATGTLWYEITGSFFALFAIFFGQHAWTLRSNWHNGPERTHLMLYIALCVVFCYFSISSFLRSRKLGKKRA